MKRPAVLVLTLSLVAVGCWKEAPTKPPIPKAPAPAAAPVASPVEPGSEAIKPTGDKVLPTTTPGPKRQATGVGRGAPAEAARAVEGKGPAEEVQAVVEKKLPD
jgi:hypothetical protein